METKQKEIWILDDCHPGNFTKELKEFYSVNTTPYAKTLAYWLYKKKPKCDLIIIQNEVPSYGFFDDTTEIAGLKSFKNEKASFESLQGFFALYLYKELIKEFNVPVLFWYWNPKRIKMAEEEKQNDPNIHLVESFNREELFHAVKEILGE